MATGSVRRMRLSVGDVTEAFAAAGRTKAAAQAESDDPNAEFIDLYIALASVPTIGRTLLGDAEYTLLRDRLAPGQQAIAVIGAGLYSFKGSGYVRGGIFDRIQLIQSDQTIRFRDRNHKHIGEIEAEHARAFKEIALFVIPDSASFDGTRPFRLDLLVNRAIGALEKDFLTFSIDYLLPERYLALPPVAASGPSTALASGAGNAAEIEDAYPLWRRIWDQRNCRPGGSCCCTDCPDRYLLLSELVCPPAPPGLNRQNAVSDFHGRLDRWLCAGAVIGRQRVHLRWSDDCTTSSGTIF